MQVIVPSDFHGGLVVHCTSTGLNSRPLRANVNGVADGACPSFQTGVTVFRAGREVSLLRAPGWTRTADGIPTQILINVD